MAVSPNAALAIKMATGWERGGMRQAMWRYETGDVALWDGLRLTARGTEERTALGEMIEDGREKDELLAAYPQLREMPLVFKDNALPKRMNGIWALIAQGVGNECPMLVQSMPKAWAMVAKCLGRVCPSLGEI